MTAQPAAAGMDSSHGSPNRRTKSIQIVEFRLGDELFAFDLFDVKEVVEYTAITKIPNVPPYMKGIIDLRGEITSILDLRQRFNIPEESVRGAEENRRFIVLDATRTSRKIGILVDDVMSVSTFEPASIDYTSASVSKNDSAIKGIIKRRVKTGGKERNELIIWIDIISLLADSDSISS